MQLMNVCVKLGINFFFLYPYSKVFFHIRDTFTFMIACKLFEAFKEYEACEVYEICEAYEACE